MKGGIMLKQQRKIVKDYMKSVEKANKDFLSLKISSKKFDKKIKKAKHKFVTMWRRCQQRI